MRLRGTFTQMDRVLTSEKAYDPRTDGIVYFPLADNIYDKYRTGKDSTDEQRCFLRWIDQPYLQNGGSLEKERQGKEPYYQEAEF